MPPHRPESVNGPLDVVVLLHGIRTRALWYDAAKALLSELSTVEVQTIGYGRFDIVRFLLPFTRRSVRKIVLKELRAIKWVYSRASRPIRLSVIAHSFGTYTITKILEEEDDIDLYNLVLCGSVLSSNYDFGRISRKVSNVIVNDAGSRDIWPVAARLVTVGYGDSGTFGFLKGLVRDRFHEFAHGDFFSNEFISRYWVSLFSTGKVASTNLDRSSKASPWPIRLLAGLPEAVIPRVILPIAGIALLATPTINATRPWLEPVLNPQSIIQADRERVCESAVSKRTPERIASTLTNYGSTQGNKAAVLCELALSADRENSKLLSLYARALTDAGATERALSVFSASAEKGDKFSIEVLADYYSHYREPNEEKSVRYYERLIAMGDADAAVSLGLLFETGIFARYDYVLAAKNYTLAAERGNQNGMYRLGQLMQFGLGIKQDTPQARELYRKAAFGGLEEAIEALNYLNRRSN